jgi:hypothetical protein
MRELILDPLGMESSTFDQERALAVRSRAIGYSGQQPHRAEIIPIVPSGALYSNVEDMARFLAHQLTEHTLDGERLVSRELLHEMRTPQFPEGRQVSGYGLGLVSEPWHGATLVYHDGGGYGYSATQRWMPEYGVGVVVLTNSSSGGSLAGALANRTLELMVGAKTGHWPETSPLQLVAGTAATPDSIELERVAGTYKPTGNLVSFERDCDTLLYIDGTDTVRLRRHAPDVFSAEDRRFTFDFSRAGRPDGVRLLSRSGVAYMTINDYPGEPRGPERPGLSSHVGTYMGDEDQVVEVYRRNEYLYMTYEGELKLTEHESGLFFTAEGESVRFDKDCMVIAGTPFARRR